MKPILLELFGFPIRGYGAFVGAALVISMSIVMRYGRRLGLKQEALLDASFASVIGGLVGGRLMFVIVHWRDFVGDPLSIFQVWEGGMMYFGGLVLGIASGTVVAIRKGLPIWRGVDTIAIAMGPGQALGRVACVVAGCCYGPRHDGPWAIVFTDPNASIPQGPGGLNGVPLLPVQIFQVFEGLALFAFALILFRYRRWDGQTFLLTLAAAGFTRIVMEGLRDDPARGFVLESVFGQTLSSSRAVGLALIAGSLALYAYRALSLRGTTAVAGQAPAA